ncbi:GlxA family transcriptional regulator [Geomonas sp. RF6]|uniref:GlxA family transcriptional regulator n=1 Tax=Geomonas sp. RF6 TaxID=2897342 RepID=UPI001E638B2A|nr:GlxA family transcriptional regulator [Geomonas sp. RF6]UFS70206.1 GlxA family transcriptional regulator [Geomonas sp. RF6]
MTGKRTVAIAAYEGAEILDVTGPIEVFDMLNRCLQDAGKKESGYHIALLAEKPGPFVTSAGIKLVADLSWHDLTGPVDTLIVVGSHNDALGKVMANPTFLEWITVMQSRVRRLVSVCTGAFLLAEAGLLDGRRVATHWKDLDHLSSRYPQVTVDTDAIYVRDGNIATSAGITAGMDLTLSLVEEDFGRQTALAVARRMVMFLKRPGGQAQFSAQLRAQMVDGGPLASLLSWLQENAHRKISIDDLACQAAMSPRNFARVFLRETGMTPARYLDKLRMERAMGLLEDNALSIGTVACRSGFSGEEQMRRTFIRQMGITPIAYRKRF